MVKPFAFVFGIRRENVEITGEKVLDSWKRPNTFGDASGHFRTEFRLELKAFWVKFVLAGMDATLCLQLGASCLQWSFFCDNCFGGFFAYTGSPLACNPFLLHRLSIRCCLSSLSEGNQKAPQPEFGAYRGLARVLKSPSNPQKPRKKEKIMEKGTFIFCAKLWYAPNPGSKEIWGRKARLATDWCKGNEALRVQKPWHWPRNREMIG